MGEQRGFPRVKKKKKRIRDEQGPGHPNFQLRAEAYLLEDSQCLSFHTMHVLHPRLQRVCPYAFNQEQNLPHLVLVPQHTWFPGQEEGLR